MNRMNRTSKMHQRLNCHNLFFYVHFDLIFHLQIKDFESLNQDDCWSVRNAVSGMSLSALLMVSMAFDLILLIKAIAQTVTKSLDIWRFTTGLPAILLLFEYNSKMLSLILNQFLHKLGVTSSTCSMSGCSSSLITSSPICFLVEANLSQLDWLVSTNLRMIEIRVLLFALLP